MSQYQAYFVPWGTDPTGKSCSVTPCVQGCKLLPERVPVAGPHGALGVTHPRQRCIEKCKAAAKNFIEWFDEQMRQGKPDYGNLPACPCKLPTEERLCYNPWPWPEHISVFVAPKGWYIAPPALYPTYLQRLHPGAYIDLRSNQVPRTQCTYDRRGELITTGPGIGTVDETSIVGGHYGIDVRPVEWIITLEGGKLKGGCWFNMYKRMRPLINRNKCPRNP